MNNGVFILLLISTPAFFSLYTNHLWEDFFITIRFSQNLAQGHGLVYWPGERIHGFTSPVGVLLPALFFCLTGTKSLMAMVWLFRVVSILAFMGAGLFLLSTFSDLAKKSKIPLLFFSLFYAFETKAVSFSVNGMETGFMLFFLAWFVAICCQGLAQNWFKGGVVLGGLMWVRPDSCVYIAILGFAQFLFSHESKKETLLAFTKAGVVCAVIYLPWFLWAWSYYGSPLPQTVQAKLVLLQRGNFEWSKIEDTFKTVWGPIYYFMGGWPNWIRNFGFGFGIFSVLYWMLPTKDFFGRKISLVVFFLFIYLAFSPGSPWYFPPTVILSLIVMTRGFYYFFEHLKFDTMIKKTLLLIVLLAMSSVSAYTFLSTAYQIRIQMKEVEFGNRMKVGLWLKDHVHAGETVYLEPLGYVGYFSQAKMLDFPGLVSPSIAALLKKDTQMNFYSLVPHISPDWIILRLGEYEKMSQVEYFQKNYRQVEIFDVRENINRYGSIPGKGYLLYDAVFYIFKKVSA